MEIKWFNEWWDTCRNNDKVAGLRTTMYSFIKDNDKEEKWPKGTKNES